MRLSRERRRTLAIVIGALAIAGGVVGYSYWRYASSSGSSTPFVCTIPQPNASWHYWVIYNASNGAIATVSGGSSYQVQPTNLTPYEVELNMTGNLTVVHQMMCDAENNQLSFWHYDQNSHQLIRNP